MRFFECVAISKKHLQSYIWVVPSLFQDATCSDLGYCVSLKQTLAVTPFFKANSQFHCSHPYGDRPLFIIKEQLQPRIVSNLLCFCRTGIVARRYRNNFDTSLISGMHILAKVCYMMTSFPAIHFFYNRVIISREHLKWYTVFISQHLLQPSIITSGLWLIRENMKGMFIWGKPLKPSESVTTESLFEKRKFKKSNCEKYVLNAQKQLQWSHSFMVNVLMC